LNIRLAVIEAGVVPHHPSHLNIDYHDESDQKPALPPLPPLPHRLIIDQAVVVDLEQGGGEEEAEVALRGQDLRILRRLHIQGVEADLDHQAIQ
jgi:hypothetical protein